ncbi:MAG TPA: RDD family protein [Sphingomonas sp.]
MRWRREPRAPRSLRRAFVTPEGVDLRLELGTAGARAGAFLLDLLMLLAILITVSIAVGYLLSAGRTEILLILWLLGAFVLRNGWFILWELGGRGATPGKRALGLRVVARDGARLSGGAVVARNAMREIEVFLPLSFLADRSADGLADTVTTLFALSWSGLFLFFPLFNRDRLRVGDLVAGTWVVRTARRKLAADLAAAPRPDERRRFSDAALGLYGVYELQTLETVLRSGQADTIATVAAAIRRKAAMPDDGDDQGFLSDYYAALCERLERGLMVGRRRADKYG